MGMKAIPASNLVVETLGLQGKLTPEKFLSDREQILHKTFASAKLMPGAPHIVSCTQRCSYGAQQHTEPMLAS